MSDLADRVQLGVLYLDDRHPGWEDKIDVEILDMSATNTCILGQLAGRSWSSYVSELHRLHDWLEEHGVSLDDDDNVAVMAGFDISPFQFKYVPLNRTWVEVLGR